MSSSLAAYHDFRARGGIADLSDRAKIRLKGPDRVRYLNGQVTANVSRASAAESLRACVTTAKGKLCADVFISAEPRAMIEAEIGGLIVDAEGDLREALLARLERYIISDDVTLEDLSERLGLLHFLPPAGAGIEALHGVFWSPVEPIQSHRFGRAGFDFFLPREALADGIGDFFETHHAVLDDALIETLRIEAGVPRWGRELGEDTLPPEAGLDRTHIDYHKGCYIGQEVISRLKSVGHVNRELTGFVSEDGTAPAAGASLFAPGGERPIGTITSAAFSFALERPIALGYLRRGSPTGGLLARPADPSSAECRVTACPLPFVSP